MKANYEPPAMRMDDIKKDFEALQKGHVNGEHVQYVPPPPEIPAEKIKEMQAYARRLMAKHPHMKLSRIQRKVAEHFKIKLDAKDSTVNPKRQAG